MTKVKLDLISDANMYLFFEKGMTGGVFYICKIYSKTNSEYLKSYDSKQEARPIIYLDANSLQCYAMFKFLPTSVLKG